MRGMLRRQAGVGNAGSSRNVDDEGRAQVTDTAITGKRGGGQEDDNADDEPGVGEAQGEGTRNRSLREGFGQAITATRRASSAVLPRLCRRWGVDVEDPPTSSALLRSPLLLPCLSFLTLVLGLVELYSVVSSRSTRDAAGEPPRGLDCWVFHHLHKSGGMTIRKIMHPPKGDLDGGGGIVGYGTDEWRQGDALIEGVYVPHLLDEKRYRIATGGYVEALRRSPDVAESCQYFTVFRHPVNRVVSAYYYCRNPKHSWDPLCASSVVSSTEVQLVDFARHWGNYGLRQFVMGLVPADDVMRYVGEVVGEERPATLDGVPLDDIPSWFLLKTYLRHHAGENGDRGCAGAGGCSFNDDAALSSWLGPVQKLVRDNYKAVGVVEEFDSTMALFDRTEVIPGTRWAATYRKLGVANKNEAPDAEQSTALRHALLSEEIKQYLRLDILLYDHAVAVFHDSARQHGIVP